MGADGHIIICRKEDFKEANPNVEPEELYLYEGEFLGEECCWGYFGDNTDGATYLTPSWVWGNHAIPKVGEQNWLTDEIYTEKRVKEIKEAVEWFYDNAESHEVWT